DHTPPARHTSTRLPLLLYTATAPSAIHTLSLHDALPISQPLGRVPAGGADVAQPAGRAAGDPDERARSRHPRRPHRRAPPRRHRSEEHTSELQSPYDLVCRLLLEKKKPKTSSTAK